MSMWPDYSRDYLLNKLNVPCCTDVNEDNEQKQEKKETVYKINEIFESIQGEGYHTGMPAIFIRLAGCSMGCKWCDTKTCQEVHYQLTAKQIVEYIEANFTRKNIVITGGEPFEQDLNQLVEKLFDEYGHSVHIETNGAHFISDNIARGAWITVSPKAYVKKSALKRASEIKLVISNEKDIERAKRLKSYQIHGEFYLQPESGKDSATKLCVKTCLEDPRFKLSVQVHKLINVR